MDRNSGRYRPKRRRSFIKVSVSARPSGLLRIERKAREAASDVLTPSSIRQPRISFFIWSEKTACLDCAISKADRTREGSLAHRSSDGLTSVLPIREKGPIVTLRSNQRGDGFLSTASTTM